MTDLVTRACKALFDTQYNGPYSAQDAIDDPELPVALHAESLVAVLHAIREPTLDMKGAGVVAGAGECDDVHYIWEAMIDTLIAEAERAADA